MATLAVVDRALDGTPLYAPRGELRIDVDEQRVQCHLCGAWYRSLAPMHLARAHGVTADEYRVLVGLLPRRALWAPDMIETHRARLVPRIAAEPRLRAAMAKGRALAQRGELQREARARLLERPVSVERERQLAEWGSRLGSARAAAFQQRREHRAVELGFASLAAYYEQRYRDERRRVDQLAAEQEARRVGRYVELRGVVPSGSLQVGRVFLLIAIVTVLDRQGRQLTASDRSHTLDLRT